MVTTLSSYGMLRSVCPVYQAVGDLVEKKKQSNLSFLLAVSTIDPSVHLTDLSVAAVDSLPNERPRPTVTISL